MEEKIKHYQKLINSSEDESNEFSHIPERIKIILRELKKETKDDIFEDKYFSQVLGISQMGLSKFLNNRLGTSFRIVFKIIELFSLMGYNPLWIINKNNMLIPKKHVESNFIMNKNTVDSAYNTLVDTIKESQENITLALDSFKGTITS